TGPQFLAAAITRNVQHERQPLPKPGARPPAGQAHRTTLVPELRRGWPFESRILLSYPSVAGLGLPVKPNPGIVPGLPVLPPRARAGPGARPAVAGPRPGGCGRPGSAVA